MTIMANARYIAATALLKIEKDKAYSNITVSTLFENSDLTPQDKALASNLVYGVLDRKITIDYILKKFIKMPLKKVAPFTLCVLRMGVHQLIFMDKIPESAAVNESVKLVKNSKENRNAGFVNAVLRNVLRSENLLPEGNTAEDLSIRFSCPLWIVKEFLSEYGTNDAIKLLEESLKAPPLTVRVNTAKCEKADLIKAFTSEGVSFTDIEKEDALILNRGMDIKSNPQFKEGMFYVQDLASQRAVSHLAPKSNTRVLDMCASPGSKSFTIAGLMKNTGEIVSCDLYENRVSLIEKAAKRLGLNIVKPIVCDATVYNEALGEFDYILCDVPCSGLGVIRRKPEIKYKEQCDFSELEKVQYKILCNAAKYLKEGGKILYSTCTLRNGENENLVKRFIKEYNVFHKAYEHTFMPHIDGTDGFYCALLEKQ